MLEWFKNNANATAIQAFAACIQLAFAFALVFIGAAQLWTYHKQRRIMEDTREIALVGLGRPHVFFEFISHNFDEWREGRTERPLFVYQFTNHGTSPAIVYHIVVRAVLSRGPNFGGEETTHIVERFPTPDQLSLFLAWNPTVRLAKQTPTGWEVGEDWSQTRVFVVNPQGSSARFATNAWSISLAKNGVWSGGITSLNNYIYEQSGSEGWVRPWLIGRIMYSDTLGRNHHTSFCIRAYQGGDYTEEGEAPYNERT